MSWRRIIYPPIGGVLYLMFLFFTSLLLLMIFIGILTFAFARLGLNVRLIGLLLFGSLIGSLINIPLFKVKAFRPMPTVKFVYFFGVPYPVPAMESKEVETTVAVNVGGAIIPVCLSLYFLSVLPIVIIPASIVTVLVAFIVYSFARPVAGLGIATPMFIPPLSAALFSMVFAGYFLAPVVAYVSGTLGTLLGADVLNIKKIPHLGAPIVSIGGAGTFDGIFLTGIIAAFLVI